MPYKITEKKTKWFFKLLILLLCMLLAFVITLIYAILNIGPETQTYGNLTIVVVLTIFFITIFSLPVITHVHLNFPILRIIVEIKEKHLRILLYDKIFKEIDLSNIKEIIVERDKWCGKTHNNISLKTEKNDFIKFRTWWMRLKKKNRLRFVEMLKGYSEFNSIYYKAVNVKTHLKYDEQLWDNSDILKFIKENKRK